ncbi:hypothetical protein D3C80_913100 [compost metagenome]
MLGKLQLVAQQAQVTVTAAQQEYARMRGMRHVRQQFVTHGPIAGMPAAIVALVIEQHQLTEKSTAQAHRLHAQPVFVGRRLGEQRVPGRRRSGHRYALVTGQRIGRAIFHQPGAEPRVAVLRAINGPAVYFVVNDDGREGARFQRQPVAGLALVQRAIDQPHILDQVAAGWPL